MDEVKVLPETLDLFAEFMLTNLDIGEEFPSGSVSDTSHIYFSPTQHKMFNSKVQVQVRIFKFDTELISADNTCRIYSQITGETGKYVDTYYYTWS